MGRVHHPWPCQDQDKEETGNQSYQEGDVWQRNDRESKACQDCRQGLRSGCIESPNSMLDSARASHTRASHMSRRVGSSTTRFIICDVLAWWGVRRQLPLYMTP